MTSIGRGTLFLYAQPAQHRAERVAEGERHAYEMVELPEEQALSRFVQAHALRTPGEQALALNFVRAERLAARYAQALETALGEADRSEHRRVELVVITRLWRESEGAAQQAYRTLFWGRPPTMLNLVQVQVGKGNGS